MDREERIMIMAAILYSSESELAVDRALLIEEEVKKRLRKAPNVLCFGTYDGHYCAEHNSSRPHTNTGEPVGKLITVKKL
jgi:hypothetical protein